MTLYFTKEENGEILKNGIKQRYSTGFYENGTQKFFVGFEGYTNKDSTHYEMKVPFTEKKEGNKTFYFGENEELIFSTKQVEDTLFTYYGLELDSPDSYKILGKNGHNVEDYDFLTNFRNRYRQPKFNNYGHLISAIMEKEYIPSRSDMLIYNEMEIDLKKAEERETLIIEFDLEYY